MKLEHLTREQARSELVKHGYWPLSVPLQEQVQPWARTGDSKRKAIGADAAGVWHIVDHPGTPRNADWLD